MQRPDDKKRAAIAAKAAKLFATKSFHEVRLEDVATAAGVGKGTLYVYFKSKEDLYFALIHDGFASLVDRLREQLDNDQGPAMGAIRVIVHELVMFAVDHPHLFELMRSIGQAKCTGEMDQKRTELKVLIEQTIRRGVKNGELTDPNPDITALCIPGFVRSIFLFGPKNPDAEKITSQLMRLLEHGLGKKEKA